MLCTSFLNTFAMVYLIPMSGENMIQTTVYLKIISFEFTFSSFQNKRMICQDDLSEKQNALE